MSERKWTPGPWRAQIDPRFDEIQVLSPTGFMLADINDVDGWTYGPTREEAIANADLMAASADLYEANEALERALLQMMDDPSRADEMLVVINARAARAKALGKERKDD